MQLFNELLSKIKEVQIFFNYYYLILLIHIGTVADTHAASVSIRCCSIVCRV